jgi:hypothetical protein
VVQIFDSWAAQLSPLDFDIWCAPYLHYIIAEAKKVSRQTGEVELEPRWAAGEAPGCTRGLALRATSNN